jgi:crotonobetainyl-CoA hydratase
VGQRGVIPHIATIILPRVVPRRRAMEWILTGREVTAGELADFGLANRLFPSGSFEDRLDAFVGELTAKSGPVLQLAKRAQYEAYYSTYEEALYRVQNMYLRELMELDDPFEGVRAHLEGREPSWRDR